MAKKTSNSNKTFLVREKKFDDWTEVEAKNAKEAATDFIYDSYDDEIKEGNIPDDTVWTVEVRKEDSNKIEIYDVEAKVEEISYKATKKVEDEDEDDII